MEHNLMRKALLALAVTGLFGILVFDSAREVSAQPPNRTFVELLKPFVGKEVRVSSRTGEQNSPGTLREVGIDYLMLENRQKSNQAILVHSIVAVRFDEVPLIQLAY